MARIARRMAVAAIALLCCGVAHAGGRHERWKAVKDLAPGFPIEVRSAGQAGLEDCRVVAADDTSLTCERSPDPNRSWGVGENARVVFPRSAVEDVWVWEDGSDRHIWIGLAVGFGIGALLCSEAGPAAAFICAGIGALIAAAVELNGLPAAPVGPGIWLPRPARNRPARQPEWHRKLWYRAPAGATVSP